MFISYSTTRCQITVFLYFIDIYTTYTLRLNTFIIITVIIITKILLPLYFRQVYFLLDAITLQLLVFLKWKGDKVITLWAIRKRG